MILTFEGSSFSVKNFLRCSSLQYLAAIWFVKKFHGWDKSTFSTLFHANWFHRLHTVYHIYQYICIYNVYIVICTLLHFYVIFTRYFIMYKIIFRYIFVNILKIRMCLWAPTSFCSWRSATQYDYSDAAKPQAIHHSIEFARSPGGHSQVSRQSRTQKPNGTVKHIKGLPWVHLDISFSDR